VWVRGEELQEGFGYERGVDLVCSGEKELVGSLRAEKVLETAVDKVIYCSRPGFLMSV
jgi:hypothetical protein